MLLPWAGLCPWQTSPGVVVLVLSRAPGSGYSCLAGVAQGSDIVSGGAASPWISVTQAAPDAELR